MRKSTRQIAFIILFSMILSGCEIGNYDTQTESEITESKTTESEITESEITESKTTESETTETETTESETTESEITESEITESEITETEIMESQITEEEMTETEVSKETETLDPNEPEVETVMYAQRAVNVRQDATATSKSIGVLKINEEVTALGDAKDGWQKVEYKGQTAYVSAKYLGLQEVVLISEITAEQVPIPDIDEDKLLVVIDAGHQSIENNDIEPLGPGSTTMKKKVSCGTKGSVSDWWEYELNLVVALKLKEELTARGYQVVMIRETHDINISNSERAKVANNLNADAFVRIHANDSENPEKEGAFTICQTSNNPYAAEMYTESRRLADCILDAFALSTGCVKRDVWETDTMSGINWAQVPVTILEMGYMSNPKEDALMATEEYQDKMVQGIANGIDDFFGK